MSCLPPVDLNAQDAHVLKYPQFGLTLEQLHDKYPSAPFGVPRIVSLCVAYLEEKALNLEGIFRISGNVHTVGRLRQEVEDGADKLSCEEPHAVSGLLRLFLKQLPDPVIPFSLYDDFIAASDIVDEAVRQMQWLVLLRKLPPLNYSLLIYVLGFLKRVAQFSSENKMTQSNLSLIFAPSFLRLPPNAPTSACFFASTKQSQVIETLLEDFNALVKESFSNTVGRQRLVSEHTAGQQTKNLKKSSEKFPSFQPPSPPVASGKQRVAVRARSRTLGTAPITSATPKRTRARIKREFTPPERLPESMSSREFTSEVLSKSCSSELPTTSKSTATTSSPTIKVPTLSVTKAEQLASNPRYELRTARELPRVRLLPKEVQFEKMLLLEKYRSTCSDKGEVLSVNMRKYDLPTTAALAFCLRKPRLQDPLSFNISPPRLRMYSLRK